MASSFEGAPLSRLAFVSTTLSSLLMSSSTKALYGLELGRVLARGEAWRLATHAIAFGSLGETVVGAIHLYRFRRFERMLGSRKFGAFALIVCSLATSLTVGLVVTLGERAGDQGLNYLRPASGPYALIFGMYPLFYSLVPTSHPRLVGIAGIDLSEKTLMYLAAAQLLLSNGLRSFIPGICGVVAGAAYLSDAFKLYTWSLPKFLDRLFRWPSAPPNYADARRPNGFDGGEQQARQERNTATEAPVEPVPEFVESLVQMGFDRQRAVEALRTSDNNLELAANRLLSSGGG